MPGIAGLIRKTESDPVANQSLLEAMVDRLNHSDRYRTETAVSSWFALAWIGLPGPEGKHLHSAGNELVSGYSGYIYGWKGSEAPAGANIPAQLTAGWQKYGYDLAEQVDGSFNLAIFDERERRAMVAADRMGHRHLYYADLGDTILFATEIKAFLASPEFQRKLDRQSVEDFFNIGYPLGDRTIFEQAKFLRGGHRLIFENGQARLQKWHDFDFGAETEQPLDDLIEEAVTIYADILPRRVAGYERMIVPLSGGLDSRFIAAYAVRAGLDTHAFTHGREGCDDHRIARLLAARLKLDDYRMIQIRPEWLIDNMNDFADYTEGMVDLSAAHLLGIGKQYNLPPESTCFLNGIFGGPTNFGSGYFQTGDIDADLTEPERCANIGRSVRAHYDMGSFQALFQPEWRKRLPQAFLDNIAEEFAVQRPLSERFHFQKDAFFIRNRLTRYMNKIDVNRFHWHDQFALSDDRLLDFYNRLPARLKPERKFMIELLKKCHPELARIEYQATGVDLFSEPPTRRFNLAEKYRRGMYYLERLSKGKFRYYDKRAYAHHNQWYRAEKRIRELYESVLLDDRTFDRCYYDREAVVRLLERQRQGGNSYYELTWLFSFEFFCRRFVDEA